MLNHTYVMYMNYANIKTHKGMLPSIITHMVCATCATLSRLGMVVPLPLNPTNGTNHSHWHTGMLFFVLSHCCTVAWTLYIYIVTVRKHNFVRMM